MESGGALQLALAALRELGGYFVWPDVNGQEYVLISRQDFDQRMTTSREQQLGLLALSGNRSGETPRPTADDMLDTINRDIALYQLQREEEEAPEEEPINESEGLVPLPPKGKPFDPAQGKRVRFEPLHGDLPPDLQE